MFQCLHVRRRKHGPVKIHTVHHCFLLRSHLDRNCVLKISGGHLDFTLTLLPPPPPPVFAFAPVFVTWGEFAVGSDSPLLFIFRSVCNLSQGRCVSLPFAPDLITQNMTVTVICISHMPPAQRQRTT